MERFAPSNSKIVGKVVNLVPRDIGYHDTMIYVTETDQGQDDQRKLLRIKTTLVWRRDLKNVNIRI